MPNVTRNAGLILEGGLVGVGSIAFTAGENLTTEKKVTVVRLAPALPIGNTYLLAIAKPAENTAGNLTIKTYNNIKIDATNARDTLHTTHTVEKITSVATYRSFLIQGLFIGEDGVKIGAKFATDSGAITIHYKLYAL